MAGAVPLALMDTVVAADWLDYNGHMNDAAYALVFSRSIDEMMVQIGLGPSVRQSTNLTIYTLQVMIHYLKEAKLDDALSVKAQLLEYDEKRLRIWLEMTSSQNGDRIAASEQLLICVDQSGATPRIAPFPPATEAKLMELRTLHAELPVPPQAGKGIALKRT